MHALRTGWGSRAFAAAALAAALAGLGAPGVARADDEAPADEPAEAEKPDEGEKPADEKPAEEKPAEEKPAEGEKPAEAPAEKPADEPPMEKPAEGEAPAEEKPAEEKPAEEKPAEAAPAPAAAPAPTGPPVPAPPPAPPREAYDEPLGYAGGRATAGGDAGKGFQALPDRWRLGFGRWDRYQDAGGKRAGVEGPYEEGAWYDPYGQNVLKADYPVFEYQLGKSPSYIFVDVSLVSDTIVEARSFPVPSGVVTNEPRREKFFGEFDQLLVNQNFVTSIEIFQGDTAFKPKDWAIKATPVFNVNYVDFEELGLRSIDVRDGTSRTDWHVGMQELLAEIHLLDLGTQYDFLSVTAGIQQFNSDFRGFMYFDNNLGVRGQVNYGANRYQANLAYFRQLEKDTNSGLNEWNVRGQDVYIASLFVQDFLSELSPLFFGYTALFNYHYNRDHSGVHFDENGFLVRPAKIGSTTGALGDFREKDLDVHYLGWGGDGHIGALNLSHQYYFAFGREENNEIAGRNQQIQAHFFAIEPSVDIDWLRIKGNFLYASGDKNPQNDTAAGFDAILDNPFFAGSGFSYFNRQSIPLVTTGVQLVNRLSLLPSLRSSKIEGKSNFVNPGLLLYGAGVSARITPKLFVDANVNLLQFAEAEVLELVLEQDSIERFIGVDYSIGVQYRPLLTENIIATVGAGALTPAGGFKEIYTGATLYSGFVSLTFTF